MFLIIKPCHSELDSESKA